MDIKTAYQKAYRHFRIQNNMDSENWYWLNREETMIPECDLPIEVDLFSEGILYLPALAVGNAIKSIEMNKISDPFYEPFYSRRFNDIGWNRYEAIRKAIDPNYREIPF